jgi:hypothetical protein
VDAVILGGVFNPHNAQVTVIAAELKPELDFPRLGWHRFNQSSKT